ncbi:MAG: flagellar biosynthesis protein FliQ [Exiguobacterium sp.]|uniref:Flagellar biosynthetic protein FliQ n=1 Tax=Exiguobacterium alkaliphilum TaxID=1428684 RepID=A0ABT2KWD9_9BACL|nr:MULTISPECIES: flagellar biosynthesis protein FliQ [Exiguobacterium]KDN57419.1 flagellar biosynthesis protein FliQ [Exiguobacterium sp. AB2]MCC5892260.1 flagellar biosynthesis protein FliQ [Exiguobacterium sp.]MCT4794020.1 flagellar biosynthesis protein FliQ [Exiguobacterium alkaliphilum]MDX5323850.1 flagellar biosynthesis protein FliQ [Exiguobacterium sp.]MDX5425670.1 flagellar biosynthesis protein FliQ [Exiguobacterium sp.]
MTQEMVIYLATESVWTLLKIAMPLLLISLVVGLVISILQATTQIQEQTLSFVPKIVSVFIGLVIFGPWMLQQIEGFTRMIFELMVEVASK